MQSTAIMPSVNSRITINILRINYRNIHDNFTQLLLRIDICETFTNSNKELFDKS